MSGIHAGRPEAAAAIWDWRRPLDDPRAASRLARRRGFVRASVALALAGIGLTFGHSTVFRLACGAGAVGLATLVAAVVSPLGALRRLESALALAGSWVGRAVTWLVMTPIFYLVFTPFGLLTRRGARDPLHRALDRTAATYWTRRDPDRPVTHERQF